MVRSESIRRGARTAVVLAGFLAGFLFMAGLYGFVFPDRLVDRGLNSVTMAYLVSTAMLLTGVAGIYLQGYVRRQFPDRGE